MHKKSVLIIAHNEEKYISKCVESVLSQTQKADEIVLLIHNSSDDTLNLAKKYQDIIKIIEYKGPEGIVYARVEGLKNVTGDIVLCIDGDSYAKKNWIEVMTKLLEQNNILVASWVKIKGANFNFFHNLLNKYLCVWNFRRKARWVWGPSFAFWGRDKNKVSEIFIKSIELSKHLNLTRNPEDLWLALFLEQDGKIEITNKTFVVANQKEKGSREAFSRNLENVRNGKIIERYWKENYGK
ncbi:MAG TPA: glycosyltransferase family 2 protein [Candidatus Paceibacterota bacterium]|nr:glycosyltransferase family 2 protein [Candidatus Paceibacterota bacterium]